MSRSSFDSQNHFEDIYLSRSTSPFYIYFQSFKNNKQLYGEYLIYPPMLIDTENRLLFFNNDQLFYQYNQQQQQQQQTQQDGSTILLDNAKLSLLRSY
ncbi:unnamed protein product, partial [Rotaria sordida]